MQTNNQNQRVSSWIVWLFLSCMIITTFALCFKIILLYKEVNNAEKFDKKTVQDFIKREPKVDASDSLHPKITYLIYEAMVDSFFNKTTITGKTERMNYDKNLLILIALCGALGSMLYILSSFTNFTGDRQLENSWLPWYVAKPFIGAGLAIVSYFIIRAGFLTATVTASDLNLFGILSFACFMGLFSDEATIKMKEFFEVIFKPKDERKGALDNSGKNSAQTSSEDKSPEQGIEILDMKPNKIMPDTENVIFEITGHNFPEDYHIKYNTEVLAKENIIEEDDNLIRFKLPKIGAEIKEVKIYIYDPKQNKDEFAGVIEVNKTNPTDT